MPHAPTISAVLIVKDEAAVLDECLTAISWVDEIIVYDTGSVDDTRAIAARHTAQVVEGSWDDDFGAARNRALQSATSEWVLQVDADEVFEGDAETLRRRLSSAEVGLLTVQIVNRSTDRAARAATGVLAVRLFRRTEYVWEGRLHEQVVPVGAAGIAVAPLPNVRLLHSGYSHELVEKHGKRDRNLRIAEAELGAGLADGLSERELAVRRANLARSLVMAGRHEEALVLADEIERRGATPPTARAQMAGAAVSAASLLGRHDEAARWLDVWEEADLAPVWSRALRVRLHASRGEWARALEVLDTLPTTLVDPGKRRFWKHDLAALEVAALDAVGRPALAFRVAARAAAAGFLSLQPGDLAGVAARAGRDLGDLAASISVSAWREYAVACGHDGSRAARHLLEAMLRVRPGDPVVLLCAAGLAPVMDLDELASWAGEIRRAGLDGACPLVSAAAGADHPCEVRALAAAMALSIYGDVRAQTDLARALDEVPASGEAALMDLLDVVAPGLVART